jgi:hypothetical protein
MRSGKSMPVVEAFVSNAIRVIRFKHGLDS